MNVATGMTYDSISAKCDNVSRRTLWTIIVIPTIVFLWEYANFYKEDVIKPSTILWDCVAWLRTFWEWLGGFFAWISSYLAWFNLDDAFKTFFALVEPIWECFASVWYFFKGYYEYMNIYEHPYMIIFGSIVLIIAVCYYGTQLWNKRYNDSEDQDDEYKED